MRQRLKIPHTSSKTQQSQINKKCIFKKRLQSEMHTPDICPCVCAASIPFHLDLNHRYMITNRQMSPWITIGMPLIPWWVSGKKKKKSPCQCKRCRRHQFDPWVKEIGNPLQYSCLGNPMDRGAWWTTVHRVAKSQMRLSDWTTTSHSSMHKSWIYSIRNPPKRG